MKEEHYLIKEAAALVGVESHVLRYWEYELKMDIGRNDMGHRYYTKRDIDLLIKIRNLKDKGLQLKAIRSYLEMRRGQLSDGEQKVIPFADKSKKNENTKAGESQMLLFEENPRVMSFEEIHSNQEQEDKDTEQKGLMPMNQQILSNEAKMEQFQRLMNRILSNAIQENNDLLGRTAGQHAADAMVNRLSGMTKEQEQRAEERFRKLDQTLREIQKARQEVAATHMRPVDKRKQARLNRKSKNRNHTSSVVPVAGVLMDEVKEH